MVDWKQLEQKWQGRWAEAAAFETDPDREKPKYYLTVAYPYPNSPQHIGHGRTYTLTDVHARYMRMRGYNVLFPMAWHYTGTPLFAMVERLKERDPALVDTFLNLYGIPESKLKELETPVSMANYFVSEIKGGMKKIGFSIDWRRTFTTVDDYYHKFIEWQFAKLRQKGYITQGSHPVGWCPSCGNPVGQHDTIGDKEPEIEEFTLIKFRKGDTVFPAATLRPETIYGVTNMWLNPDAVYVEATVDGETWIVSAEAARKLDMLGHKVKVETEFQGARLIGQTLTNPATGKEIIILPAPFVDPKNATGVVMSVPAVAPFDYVALEQLKREVHTNPDAYTIKHGDIANINLISVVEIPGYSEFPAVDVIKRMNITDQNSPDLEKATKELYSAEFHAGKMMGIAKQYVGLAVQVAKPAVKNDLIANNNAATMYEMIEPVQCRCGTEVVVKIFENQWFINYGDEAWKKLARENIDQMEIVPRELKQEFFNVVDWLKAKACARKAGMGTRLPWEPDWIIESLSDSTIYMAYYTVIKGLNEVKPKPEQLNEAFWDYVFLGIGTPVKVETATGIPMEKIEELHNEFSYFYPMDARHSGRDLIPNHLTFMIFIHDAIWGREYWPQGIFVNGSVLMEGAKMSKSMNNIIPLVNAIDRFGADPLRISLMITAEPLKDADFSPDLAKSMMGLLEGFYARAQRIISREAGGLLRAAGDRPLDAQQAAEPHRRRERGYARAKGQEDHPRRHIRPGGRPRLVPEEGRLRQGPRGTPQGHQPRRVDRAGHAGPPARTLHPPPLRGDLGADGRGGLRRLRPLAGGRRLTDQGGRRGARDHRQDMHRGRHQHHQGDGHQARDHPLLHRGQLEVEDAGEGDGDADEGKRRHRHHDQGVLQG